MRNLALFYVLSIGKDVKGVREEYDGACIDFAGDFQDWLQRGRLVYFDALTDPVWKYHCAVEIDGMIHDLWRTKVMPTVQFAESLGCSDISYPCEENV